ncbi:GNAT family N-acetyltransferase [Caulobacter sp. UNC358MFTsu5.1]|uniref:GNAT family N-acetyltransferase n=1 Tax=Caulobacter sp. UNC358MFTsu5.1 TaxID=1449049 RepID=UPI00068E6D46|nr:GNAT family N-acetyltransferase [Caulobacter sp. UNC358MFTsu5.1]
MDFRTARSQDAEAIAALHADSWRRTYRGMMPDAFLDGPVLENRLEIWRARLADGRTDPSVWLGVEHGQVVGFICVHADEDSRWGSLIDNLHVRPESQQMGVGARLMGLAADWLDDQCSGSPVYLWAMKANHGARRFYERLGGRHVESLIKTDVAGGLALNCRYVWRAPAAIARVSKPNPAPDERGARHIERPPHEGST